MQFGNHTNSTSGLVSTNHQVADHLLEAANILRQKGANPYRIRAYRSAARTIENLQIDLVEIIEQDDLNGLIKLPFVGKNIAYAVYEMVATGKWDFLESLRNSLEPPRVFRLVPGVGPKLANNIYTKLHVETLEELELAANSGKLTEIPGIGERRQRMITETLKSILHDTQRSYHTQSDGPKVDVLLKMDRIYRKKAEQGLLQTIAPKRFNPSRTSWLPIMNYRDDNWKFRIMYSNTERAHRLHKLSDWVIVHAFNDTHHEFNRTIVTETRGLLKGKRVVRGYEGECMEHYKKY
ncbi:MAG: helix-hairpin-helix domain-containing protein [Gammaproteobacteria bacterium]